MRHADEMHWFTEVLGWTGPSVEFNVLDDLWTSRVTSHVPLKDVAGLLSVSGVADGIGLLYRGLQSAGKPRPKLAVCALNPHGGDGGNFGREEIEIIEPGVRLAPSKAGPPTAPTLPTRSSCAPRAARTMASSRCITTRARSR